MEINQLILFCNLTTTGKLEGQKSMKKLFAVFQCFKTSTNFETINITVITVTFKTFVSNYVDQTLNFDNILNNENNFDICLILRIFLYKYNNQIFPISQYHCTNKKKTHQKRTHSN